MILVQDSSMRHDSSIRSIENPSFLVRFKSDFVNESEIRLKSMRE